MFIIKTIWNLLTAGITGSWSAAVGDETPWVGVVFTHYVIVTGITTVGGGDKEEWVIDFRLSYRLQTGSFFEYYRRANGIEAVSHFLSNLHINSLSEVIEIDNSLCYII